MVRIPEKGPISSNTQTHKSEGTGKLRGRTVTQLSAKTTPLPINVAGRMYTQTKPTTPLRKREGEHLPSTQRADDFAKTLVKRRRTGKH